MVEGHKLFFCGGEKKAYSQLHVNLLKQYSLYGGGSEIILRLLSKDARVIFLKHFWGERLFGYHIPQPWSVFANEWND